MPEALGSARGCRPRAALKPEGHILFLKPDEILAERPNNIGVQSQQDSLYTEQFIAIRQQNSLR